MARDRFEQTFEASDDQVPAVRRFTRSALSAFPALAIDDVILVVCELATNAVIHGRSPFTVTIMVRTRTGSIMVEVADLNPRLPIRTPTDVTALSGRGLGMIDELSSSWGVRPRACDGKTVWAEIATAHCG